MNFTRNHVEKDGDTKQLCTQQKDEDGCSGGGGAEEAKELFPKAGVGEKQGRDGEVESEVEEEWLASHCQA